MVRGFSFSDEEKVMEFMKIVPVAAKYQLTVTARELEVLIRIMGNTNTDDDLRALAQSDILDELTDDQKAQLTQSVYDDLCAAQVL
jgi:hypothetical protein